MNNMERIVKYMGRSPNSPITLRAMIDPKFAFRIIGPQGNVHQYIQTTYAVKLYLHDDGDHYGRLCSIAGPVSNVARAWREVICVIFYKAIQGKQRIWLKLLIPSELAIKLQQVPAKTSAGCMLNEIAAASNARITIEPAPLVNTTEHILEVSLAVGEKFLDHFTKALTMIGRQFQIYRHEALSPKNIYYTPNCYKKPPILEDEDEEESDDDDGYYYNYNNDIKNGKRPQQQPQPYQHHQHIIARSKDKGKATALYPIVESSTSASKPTATLHQSWTLPSSSSSSCTSHLAPMISEVSTVTISPKSIIQQLDHTSTSYHHTCQ